MTRLWEDMSRAEKGEILLAYHEGETIQFNVSVSEIAPWIDVKEPTFNDLYAYRVKPTPKIKKVELYFGELTVGAMRKKHWSDTHKLTLTLVDGVAPVGRFVNENGDAIVVEQFSPPF
jgi:hypothetical protein